MKYQFVIVLLCFAFFSCNNSAEKNGTKTKIVTTTPATSTEAHDGHDHDGHDHAGHDHAGHDHSGHNHAEEGGLLLGAFIGIWEFHHSSSKVKNGYIKHWLDIKPDMTFEKGIGSKLTNKGKWNVVEEKGEMFLDLDYENNASQVDEKWRTQMNNPVLILIGNSDKMKTGEMIKLDKREKRPEDF